MSLGAVMLIVLWGCAGAAPQRKVYPSELPAAGGFSSSMLPSTTSAAAQSQTQWSATSAASVGGGSTLQISARLALRSDAAGERLLMGTVSISGAGNVALPQNMRIERLELFQGGRHRVLSAGSPNVTLQWRTDRVDCRFFDPVGGWSADAPLSVMAVVVSADGQRTFLRSAEYQVSETVVVE